MTLPRRLAPALAALALAFAPACGGGSGGGDLPVDIRIVPPDARDVLPGDADPDVADAASDGTTPTDDAADPGVDFGPEVPPIVNDTDEDGIPDGTDNCPLTPNLDQEDVNQNQVGDACDLTLDTDGDGVADFQDEAPADKDWPGRVTVLNRIYAHTSTGLFSWNVGDPAPVKVANFAWPADGGGHEMTDLAIDRDGLMYGVSFDHIYRVSATSGKTRSLGVLSGQFNGMTVVQKGTVDPNVEALIAISNSGGWIRVKVVNGVASFQPLGSYGGYSSAGDAFCIEDRGTWAAVEDGVSSGTILVEVNPATGAVLQEIGNLNMGSVYGLAGVGGKIYAFSSSGEIAAFEVSTKKVTTVLQASKGQPWWGAAVSTRGK